MRLSLDLIQNHIGAGFFRLSCLNDCCKMLIPFHQHTNRELWIFLGNEQVEYR